MISLFSKKTISVSGSPSIETLLNNPVLNRAIIRASLVKLLKSTPEILTGRLLAKAIAFACRYCPVGDELRSELMKLDHPFVGVLRTPPVQCGTSELEHFFGGYAQLHALNEPSGAFCLEQLFDPNYNFEPLDKRGSLQSVLAVLKDRDLSEKSQEACLAAIYAIARYFNDRFGIGVIGVGGHYPNVSEEARNGNVFFEAFPTGYVATHGVITHMIQLAIILEYCTKNMSGELRKKMGKAYLSQLVKVQSTDGWQPFKPWDILFDNLSTGHPGILSPEGVHCLLLIDQDPTNGVAAMVRGFYELTLDIQERSLPGWTKAGLLVQQRLFSDTFHELPGLSSAPFKPPFIGPGKVSRYHVDGTYTEESMATNPIPTGVAELLRKLLMANFLAPIV